MSTKYWLGQSTSVAKVITLTVSNPTPGETFSIISGGVTIVSYEAITADSGDDIIANLVSLWNLSAHPYARTITAAVGAGISMTLTGDAAGWDFDVTPSVDVSTISDFTKTVTTALKGPNVWSDGDNWWDVDAGSLGVAPVNSDDVIVSTGSKNICWGLDQNAVLLNSLRVDLTYTGRIGLRTGEFATTADGETHDATVAREYREKYLKIGITRAELGKRLDTGTPNGSRRMKINNVATGTSTTVVHETGNTSAETNLPATRLLFNSASADLFVIGARAGVGVAIDEPGETATMRSIAATPGTSSDRILLGDGTTLSSWRQNNGDCALQCQTFVETVTVDGGTLTTKGDFTIGTLNANSGTVVLNHINSSSGTEIDTLNLKGADIDMTQSEEPRIVGALNPDTGSIALDSNVVTVTTWNEPTGQRSVSFST